MQRRDQDLDRPVKMMPVVVWHLLTACCIFKFMRIGCTSCSFLIRSKKIVCRNYRLCHSEEPAISPSFNCTNLNSTSTNLDAFWGWMVSGNNFRFWKANQIWLALRHRECSSPGLSVLLLATNIRSLRGYYKPNALL